MNQIIYLDEAISALTTDAPDSRKAAVSEVHGQLREDFPIELSIVEAVTYSDKTDRYVLKAGKTTARVTNEVAAYLLTHGCMARTYGARPTVRATMADGIIDSVALIFISREN